MYISNTLQQLSNREKVNFIKHGTDIADVAHHGKTHAGLNQCIFLYV